METLNENITCQESSMLTQTSVFSMTENKESSRSSVSSTEPLAVQTEMLVRTATTVQTEQAEFAELAVETESLAGWTNAEAEAKKGDGEALPNEQAEEEGNVVTELTNSAEILRPFVTGHQTTLENPPALSKRIHPSCNTSTTDSGFSEITDGNKGLSTLIPTGLPGIFAFPVAVMAPVALLIRSVIKDKTRVMNLSKGILDQQISEVVPKEVKEIATRQEISEMTYASGDASAINVLSSPTDGNDFAVTPEISSQGIVTDSDIKMQLDKEIKILVPDDKMQEEDSEVEDLSIDGDVPFESREWRGEYQEYWPMRAATGEGENTEGARTFGTSHNNGDYFGEVSEGLRPGGTPSMVLSFSPSSTFNSSIPRNEMSEKIPGSEDNPSSIVHWSTDISAWSTVSQTPSEEMSEPISSTLECVSLTRSSISLPSTSESATTTNTDEQITITEPHLPTPQTIAEPSHELELSILESQKSVSSPKLPSLAEGVSIQRTSTSASIPRKAKPIREELSPKCPTVISLPESQVTVLQSLPPRTSLESSPESSPLPTSSSPFEAANASSSLRTTTHQSSRESETSDECIASKRSPAIQEQAHLSRPQIPHPNAAPCEPSAQLETLPTPFLSPCASPSTLPTSSPVATPSVSPSVSRCLSATHSTSSPSSMSSQDFVLALVRPPDTTSSGPTLFAALPAALRALESAKASDSYIPRCRRDLDLGSIVEEEEEEEERDREEMLSSAAMSWGARVMSASTSGSSNSDHFMPADTLNFDSTNITYSGASGMCGCTTESRCGWSTGTGTVTSASSLEGERQERLESASPMPPEDQRWAHSAPASSRPSCLPLFVAAPMTSADAIAKADVTGTDMSTDSQLPRPEHPSPSFESSAAWSSASGFLTNSEAFRKFLGVYETLESDSSEVDSTLEESSTCASPSISVTPTASPSETVASNET